MLRKPAIFSSPLRCWATPVTRVSPTEPPRHVTRGTVRHGTGGPVAGRDEGKVTEDRLPISSDQEGDDDRTDHGERHERHDAPQRSNDTKHQTGEEDREGLTL